MSPNTNPPTAAAADAPKVPITSQKNTSLKTSKTGNKPRNSKEGTENKMQGSNDPRGYTT